MLLAMVVAVLALPGATLGGSYVPPPGDALPVWSPDGRSLAFATSRGAPAVAVVAADGSNETRIIDDFGLLSPYGDPIGVALSPDWRWAAVLRVFSGALLLVAVRLDGSEERQLAHASYGTRPAWSPNAQRIAFRFLDGTLAAVDSNGSNFARLASRGTTPAWSPNSGHVAFAGGEPVDLDLHVVDGYGRSETVVVREPGMQLEPKWSPDGTRLAFLTQAAVGAPFELGVVRADGSDLRSYPGPGVSNPDAFAWTPDGRAIVYAKGATQGLFQLDLSAGRSRRLTAFGGTPAVSPDGRRIAFAGGGECRDRSGIYVATIAAKSPVRLTNDCRLVGTPGDDELRGTGLADVLVGLAGDDRLVAWDPGYVGDTLLGGAGDDVLIGRYRDDLLSGGSGSDLLFGGLSGDELSGGPGADRLVAQAGQDRVYARDGERDVIVCGTNRGGTPERDEAWVDRPDRVASDCEIAHRGR